MAITHTLSDFLSSLSNHSKANKIKMCHPQTKIIQNLATVLASEGFTHGFQMSEDDKHIYIYLKQKQKVKYINKIEIVSKPGKRFYIKNAQISERCRSGTYIMSTSGHGLITTEEAKRLNCGGELICRIT
jgi:small subunit ribosomal protein S8